MVIVLQRRIPPVVGLLIVLTLVTSLIAALDARAGGELYLRLALIPDRVWRGEVWRLATWLLVELGPWSLIFACVDLGWFGGDLEAVWGSDRFGRALAAVVLVAGLGTTLAALAIPGAGGYGYFGGTAVGVALLIAWALYFPDRRIRIHAVLVVGGPTLAYGALLVIALFAVFYGLAAMLPELLAGTATLAYMTGGHRRLTRALRRFRAGRLGVVRGGRHSGPSDRN